MAKEIFSSLDELFINYQQMELGKAKDLTNIKYNRLLPICRVNKTSANNGAQWACKCDCGNYIVALGSQIISGHTSSCGCYNKELTKEACRKVGQQSNFKDYTKIDNPFYIFINPTTEKTNNGLIWNIKCKKCDKIYQDIPSQIISDTRRKGNNPCECWRHTSKGALKLEQILNDNNIPYEKEYKFQDCLSPKGNPMKFDYYIDNKYIIEYDGEQHNSPQSFGSTTQTGEEKLELSQLYDSIKNQYCKEKNITLIRIPYTQYKNLCLEDLQPETSQFILI